MPCASAAVAKDTASALWLHCLCSTALCSTAFLAKDTASALRASAASSAAEAPAPFAVLPHRHSSLPHSPPSLTGTAPSLTHRPHSPAQLTHRRAAALAPFHRPGRSRRPAGPAACRSNQHGRAPPPPPKRCVVRCRLHSAASATRHQSLRSCRPSFSASLYSRSCRPSFSASLYSRSCRPVPLAKHRRFLSQSTAFSLPERRRLPPQEKLQKHRMAWEGRAKQVRSPAQETATFLSSKDSAFSRPPLYTERTLSSALKTLPIYNSASLSKRPQGKATFLCSKNRAFLSPAAHKQRPSPHPDSLTLSQSPRPTPRLTPSLSAGGRHAFVGQAGGRARSLHPDPAAGRAPPRPPPRQGGASSRGVVQGDAAW